MNRYFFLLIFLLPLKLNALTSNSWEVNLVSHTRSADNGVRIRNTNPGDIVQAIHISSCSNTAGAYLSVGDSSGTVVSTFAVISTWGTSSFCPAIGTHELGVRLTSAASYQNIGGAIVTFLIKNENRQDGE